MFGVGRDLYGSSSPTLLPKQGRIQQAAQDLVQAGLECFQRKRLHNLPGQPVPVLRHPQREEVPPHVQTELPKLQFVVITRVIFPIVSICQWSWNTHCNSLELGREDSVNYLLGKIKASPRGWGGWGKSKSSKEQNHSRILIIYSNRMGILRF